MVIRCRNIFIKKNVMFTTFSQQIISSKLLQVVIGGQKSSFIGKFKIRTNNNLLCMVCYESVVKNIVDIVHLFSQ